MAKVHKKIQSVRHFLYFLLEVCRLLPIFVPNKHAKPMRLRNTLVTIVIIKLIIIAVIKFVFFPDFLKKNAADDEAGYVATQILNQ